MTPRHALQAAALQFGKDGSERSLLELYIALANMPADGVPDVHRSVATTRAELVPERVGHLPSYDAQAMRDVYPDNGTRYSDFAPGTTALGYVQADVSDDEFEPVPATLTESHSE
jgi:hypothetical protein